MAFAAAVIGCQVPEMTEPQYVPGEADNAFCYGVSFPKQDASGNHVVDPVDPTVITITVVRTNTFGDIEVPYSIVSTADGKPVEGIFEGGKILFADGQPETTFDVTYPTTQVGVAYECTIKIEDKEYASIYSESAPQITFGITRVKWNDIGKVRVREDMLASTSLSGYVSPVHPVLEAQIFERDDMPGMFRVKGLYSPENVMGWLKPDYKEYHDGADAELFFVLDATNPKKVWIQYTSVGWQFFSNGVFYIGSLVDDNAEFCPTISSKAYPSYVSDDNYGTLVDNVITFPAKGLCYGFEAADWWNVANNEGMTYFALPARKDAEGKDIPAGVPVDYSLKVATDLTGADGVPVAITAGMDIESVKWAVYEGELNAAQSANRAAAIADGTDASTEFTNLVANAAGNAKNGAFAVEAEKTGVYTIVVVGFDKDKKEQSNASASFTYVAEGDEDHHVVLECGLEATGKYASQGFTKENSLEFYIFGKNIVDAKVGIFKKLDIIAKGEEEIVSTLLASTSLSDAAIESINKSGYVDLAKGLVPGTEFYLYVWASNGFEEEVFTAGGTFTEGDPLPIYQDFAVSNYYEAGAFANAEAAIGTWNLYGVDFDGSLGMREYLGKSVITASETPTEGPDSYGLYDEYVYVSGLFGDLSWLANYGITIDDRIEMDVYDGVMYTTSNALVNDPDEACTVYLYSKGQGSFGWDYADAYWTCFIPVMDGYYAFVDVKYGASYNFCGLGLLYGNSWTNRISEQLLVDPAKDDNGVAPASIQHNIQLFQDIASNHVSLTASPKARMREIIDQYNQKVVFNLFNPAGIDIVREPKQVNVKVSAAEWFEPVVEVPAGAPVAPARANR